MLVTRLETTSQIWMKCGPSFEESTSKTSLKFAWNFSTRLPASPYGKKDDVRSFLGSWFSENFIYWDTGLRWKQSSFQIGCHVLIQWRRWTSRWEIHRSKRRLEALRSLGYITQQKALGKLFKTLLYFLWEYCCLNLDLILTPCKLLYHASMDMVTCVTYALVTCDLKQIII